MAQIHSQLLRVLFYAEPPFLKKKACTPSLSVACPLQMHKHCGQDIASIMLFIIMNIFAENHHGEIVIV